MNCTLPGKASGPAIVCTGTRVNRGTAGRYGGKGRGVKAAPLVVLDLAALHLEVFGWNVLRTVARQVIRGVFPGIVSELAAEPGVIGDIAGRAGRGDIL